MELWIRSQDKLRLAKIESVIINYNMQTEILGNCYSADGIEKDIPLGEYATKERTLEVLDEIQDIIIAKSNMSLSEKVFEKSFDGFNQQQIEKALKTLAVYQMPEE